MKKLMKHLLLVFFEKFVPKLKTIYDCLNIDDVNIYSSHVFDDLNISLEQKVNDNNVNILLAHHLISKDGAIFEVHKTSDLPCTFDLVLSGDLHTGFDTHVTEKDGRKTIWSNPGSIARKEINSALRKPSVLIIDIEDKDAIDVKTVNLSNVKAPEEVFKESILEVIKESPKMAGEEFVENILDLNFETVEIFTLLRMAGEKENIDKEILDYIDTYREEK